MTMDMDAKAEALVKGLVESYLDNAIRNAFMGIDVGKGRDFTALATLSPATSDDGKERTYTVRSHYVLQPKQDPNIIDSTARVIEDKEGE